MKKTREYTFSLDQNSLKCSYPLEHWLLHIEACINPNAADVTIKIINLKAEYVPSLQSAVLKR
jgi:hypothetical protein